MISCTHTAVYAAKPAAVCVVCVLCFCMCWDGDWVEEGAVGNAAGTGVGAAAAGGGMEGGRKDSGHGQAAGRATGGDRSRAARRRLKTDEAAAQRQCGSCRQGQVKATARDNQFAGDMARYGTVQSVVAEKHVQCAAGEAEMYRQ